MTHVMRLPVIVRTIFAFAPVLATAFMLAGALATTGCNSSGYDIPSGAFRFVTPDQLDALAKMGAKIHQGLHPPAIEGTYLADTLVRTGGNIPNETALTFDAMNLRFSGQTSDNQVMVSYAQRTEVGKGLGAFISGSGNSFTIFTQITGTLSAIPFSDAVLYSGTISPTGIADFQDALLLTQKGLDPSHMLLELNQGRVVTENDRLAIRTLTFP